MAVGDDQGQETKLLCTLCNGELSQEGECTTCGARHEIREGSVHVTAPEEPPAKEAFLEAVSRVPGLGPAKAEALFESGYNDFALLGQASVEELAQIEGFGETLAEKVVERFHGVAPAPAVASRPEPPSQNIPPQDQKDLARWLKGEADSFESWLGVAPASKAPAPEEASPAPAVSADGEGEPPVSPKEPAPAAVAPPVEAAGGATDALRRWLMGEEEDLEAWLEEPGRREESTPRPAPPPEEEGDVEALRAELAELKRALRGELERVKGGQFDPVRYLEEIAELNKKLHKEVQARRELESELDHMKKSSMAVIKYVKSQRGQEEGPEARRKLAEEREAQKELQREVTKLQSLLSRAQEELQGRLQDLPADAKAVKEAELRLAEHEAELQALEEELREERQQLEAERTRLGDEDLQQRLQAELTEKEREFVEQEAELKKRIVELEGEVDRLRIDAKLRAEAIEMAHLPGEDMDEKLVEKAADLQEKEKALMLREEEIKRLREELSFKEEELQKVKEPVAYKEEELLRREEDLIYREKLLEAEKAKVEKAKAMSGNVEEIALKERLESLKSEISQKEEEVRAREKYLKSKMEELRLREQGLIEEEIDARDEERRLELKQEKAKTGTPRLDDLLLGGIPFGSNVSIYGPPFIGKEVIVNAFIAEGLKKGIPALWVITDKTPEDIREEMQYVLPGYEEYEKLGLAKYVDAYSKGMGTAEPDPNVTYLDDPTDHEAILKNVDKVAAQLRAEHPNYRLAFRSISTLIAYLDPGTTFKFLQPFAGKRKRDRAISLYVIEKGMHGEQEIQLLGSVMDGMVEFKVEQLKTFLSVKGVCDVQSRAWIQYMYSKQGLSIGSFSLDHIK